MKKSKLLLLIPAAGLLLSGCSFDDVRSWIGSNIYGPIRDAVVGKKEEKKEDTKPTPEPGPVDPVDPVDPEGTTISFADFVAAYEAKGYSGVEIPDYHCESEDATFSPIEGYDDYYLIKPSTSEEMKAFVDSFSSAWEDEVDDYGDHYLYLGSPEPGESCPFIYVADYTAESLAGIVLAFSEYTEPVPVAAFPLAEVNAYLEENASGYGFTLSQAEADAISALATSFVFESGTDSYGYPIAYVIMNGEIASQVLGIIESTISAAGFSFDEEDEVYYNSNYWAIYAVEQEGSTYLVFN